MDGNGGCCIARYGGGTYDISSVDRIMMRFRPIAPKPANTASASGASSPEISETSSRLGRGKRRLSTTNGSGNRRCNSGSNNRKRKGPSEEKREAVVTLRLLPETPDRKDTPGKEKESPADVLFQRQTKNFPAWLSFGSNGNSHDETMISGGLGIEADRAAVKLEVMRAVIGSCVTVECITDTWVDVDGLGRTDKERRANLGKDSCPGFISDSFGRVTWTNEAYKKMVGKGELVVWLVMKEEAAAIKAEGSSQAFTCRVRVQNHKNSGNEKERSSITVPCDVWRMDGGGFAWRLDVKAALTLGW